jgi:hypothetical protein
MRGDFDIIIEQCNVATGRGRQTRVHGADHPNTFCPHLFHWQFAGEFVNHRTALLIIWLYPNKNLMRCERLIANGL